MSHIGEEVGAGLISKLAHALILDQAAVRGSAGYNDLGAVEVSQLGHLLVIDDAGLLIQPVWESLEVLGDGGDLLAGDLVAVRQVAAVGKIEGEDAVVDVHDGGVSVQIGRRPRKG